MTDYLQGIEYKDGKLEAVYAPEGRLAAIYDGNGAAITHYRAEYWLKDHLGNTRLAFSDENNDGRIAVKDDAATPQVNEAEIMAENHYYLPMHRDKLFGMNQDGPWYSGQNPANQYRYNGKELNEDLGLYWSDYGARWYDAALGRWSAVDPLGEKYVPWSIYNYVLCNPLKYIDTDGMRVDGWIEDADGNVMWDRNTNSQEEFNENYRDKEGYSYASDSDNPNSYTLPNGVGKVMVNDWKDYPVENGRTGVFIDLKFIPSDENADSGWFQTFESNVPDVDSRNFDSVLPRKTTEERLDGRGIEDRTDVKQAIYFGDDDFNAKSNKLSDFPSRRMNGNVPVNWRAQSSMIIDGKKSFSVGWGFSITSQKTSTPSPPIILKSNTQFHNQAIKKLD